MLVGPRGGKVVAKAKGVEPRTCIPTPKMIHLPFLVEIEISRLTTLKSRERATVGCERAPHELSIDTKNAQND